MYFDDNLNKIENNAHHSLTYATMMCNRIHIVK